MEEWSSDSTDSFLVSGSLYHKGIEYAIMQALRPIVVERELMKAEHITLLDLCCGFGLAADGYRSVGFDVWGIDKFDMPQYPGSFIKGDIIETLNSKIPENFAALHASPPCQLFTTARHLYNSGSGGNISHKYVDLLTPTVELLRTKWSHKPWVIENVDDNMGEVRKIMAKRPGESLITLCGSMFGLGVQRHRVFLSNIKLRQPICNHSKFEIDPVTGNPRPWGVYHQPGHKLSGYEIKGGGRVARDENHAREVMGVYRSLPWDGLKEGIPPAYAAHIGADLLVAIDRQKR